MRTRRFEHELEFSLQSWRAHETNAASNRSTNSNSRIRLLLHHVDRPGHDGRGRASDGAASQEALRRSPDSDAPRGRTSRSDAVWARRDSEAWLGSRSMTCTHASHSRHYS